ncbi:MAG: nucleotide exchange factor GrpE [Candidatus Caldatribacteriaceae bacterium]
MMKEEYRESSSEQFDEKPYEEAKDKNSALQDEVERLKVALEEEKKKFEEQEKLVKEYLSDLKRVKADFDNFRKREMVYRQSFVKTANRDLILKVLPILDDMEKALIEGKKGNFDADPFYQGVELIYRKFVNLLEKEGVKQIVVEGRKFDPKYHEAMSIVSIPEREDFEIVEELRKGYLLYEEVLRPAQVKVNRISEDRMA